MAMTNEELMQILTETGAYQTGHFKLSSGLHSGNYIQCSQLLKFPRVAEKVCSEIAALFKDDNIEMVVGPAIGGILVAYEVGRALDVPAIFAERQDGKMTLRRGFHVEPGTRCLVTEDVLTTGGSAQEVVELLQAQGADHRPHPWQYAEAQGAIQISDPAHLPNLHRRRMPNVQGRSANPEARQPSWYLSPLFMKKGGAAHGKTVWSDRRPEPAPM